MTALAAGINATRQSLRGESWSLAQLSPRSENWDAYNIRLSRYGTYEHYMFNSVFTTLETQAWKHLSGTNHELYKHTRPIYNCVDRLIKLYMAILYGGALDLANLDGGAIPIQTDNEAVKAALKQLYIWSNWQQSKTIPVLNGAGKGDAFIKIVSQPSSAKVWMENLKPEYVKELEHDERGNVKSIVICYDRYDATYNRWHEYEEYIDQDRFLTYRDGALHPWYEDASGTPVAEWVNEYGFVPVVHIKHRDIGRQFGVCAYNESIPKIDELNSLASATHDQIKKSVNAVWAIFGATKPAADPNLDDRKDTVPWVYFPEGTDTKPMVANLDFASALAVMRSQIDEIEAGMPELKLHNLSNIGGQMSGVAIETLMMPAVGLFTESMGNYDAGLIHAQEMAMTIGGVHGYQGFGSFNLNSYAAGDLTHTIKPRSVIRDKLGRAEKLTALANAGTNPLVRLILKELEYSDDEIEEAVLDAAEITLAQQASVMTSQLSATGAGLRQPPQQQPVAPNGQPVPPQPNGNGVAANDR